jgi:histone deacetylase 8
MAPCHIVYVASEKLAKVRPFLVLRLPNLSCSQSSSLLPSNRNRSAFVHALITALGLLRRRSTESHPPPSHQLTVLRPCPASPLELTSYHDRSYIDALLTDPPGLDPASCREFGLEDVIAASMISVALVLTFGTQDCPPFPGLSEYVLGIAGASLTAARELAEGRCDIAICWDGGRSLPSLTSSQLSAECPQTPRS